jgi:hypothetical protein
MRHAQYGLYPNTKRLPERRQVAIGISGAFPGYFRVGKIRNLSLIDLVYFPK